MSFHFVGQRCIAGATTNDCWCVCVCGGGCKGADVCVGLLVYVAVLQQVLLVYKNCAPSQKHT